MIVYITELPCRSEPYDPYLGAPAGPSQGIPKEGNTKTADIQRQIDDTVGIMRNNITKVAERGEALETLQDKTGTSRIWLVCNGRNCISYGNFCSLISTDALAASAQGFRRGANRVRKVCLFYDLRYD